MGTYEDMVAKLQAEAMEAVARELVAVDRANDKTRRDKQFLLMLMVEARLTKKLSQSELAEKIGIAQSTIARIESGRGNPSLRTLLKIAKALDVRLVLE